MKYVAVFEIPDDKIGLLELTLPTGDGLTVTSPIEFKKAPKPRRNLKGITVEDFYERAGYNRALRDCGVLEE
jgi:hypothetical protein